jgi:hypothetical protein
MIEDQIQTDKKGRTQAKSLTEEQMKESRKECQTPNQLIDSFIQQQISQAKLSEKEAEQSGRYSSQKRSSESNESKALSNAQLIMQQKIRGANELVKACLQTLKEQSDKKLKNVDALPAKEQVVIYKENADLCNKIAATNNHINNSSLSPLCPISVSNDIDLKEIHKQCRNNNKPKEKSTERQVEEVIEQFFIPA